MTRMTADQDLLGDSTVDRRTQRINRREFMAQAGAVALLPPQNAAHSTRCVFRHFHTGENHFLQYRESSHVTLLSGPEGALWWIYDPCARMKRMNACPSGRTPEASAFRGLLAGRSLASGRLESRIISQMKVDPARHLRALDQCPAPS